MAELSNAEARHGSEDDMTDDRLKMGDRVTHAGDPGVVGTVTNAVWPLHGYPWATVDWPDGRVGWTYKQRELSRWYGPPPPKYSCGMGDPLDVLAEEASEVVKERFKWLRFGPHDDHGHDAKAAMEREIGEMLAMVDHCIEVGLLDGKAVLAGMRHKRQRVKDLFGETLRGMVR